MAAGARRLADPGELARISKDLPIYIMAGDADPVNQKSRMAVAARRALKGPSIARVRLLTSPPLCVIDRVNLSYLAQSHCIPHPLT